MASRTEYPKSKYVRDKLKALAVVADIQNDVRLAEYHKLAVELQQQADKSLQKGALEQAFVDYWKMFTLAGEKIPRHNAYSMKQYATEKQWFLNARNDAFSKIEWIVQALEHQELQREHQMELSLIDEFDGDSPVLSSETSGASDLNYSPESLSVEQAFAILRLEDKKKFPPATVFVTPQSSAIGSVLEATPSSSTQTTRTSSVVSSSNALSTRSLPISSNDPNVDLVLLGTVPLLPTEAIDILRAIGDIQRIAAIPSPMSKVMEIYLGSDSYMLCQDDFHVSFSLFLSFVPPRLQILDSAVETNRCFFVHLGVAMGIHPFALQCAFRIMARLCLPIYKDDVIATEILNTVLDKAGFVDAQVFMYLWPVELYNARICIISGDSRQPVISVFESPAVATGNPSDAIEIIIRCEHGHFTLVRPIAKVTGQQRSFSFLSKFLTDAGSHGVSVQMYTISVSRRWSIMQVIKKILTRPS